MGAIAESLEPRAQLSSDTRELDPKLQLLRNVGLFEDLEADTLAALAASATLRTYAKGALVVRKDDPSQSLLVVASGSVQVVLDPQGAEPVRLGEFRRGEYFGEMSLLDGAPRSASVIALESSEILELPREAVLSRLTPVVSRKLLQDLATRIRRTHGTVSELAEKVYHAAYANVHAAVRVELETIKTLYQRTEQVSTRTLEEAERCAQEATSDANRIVASVQTRIDDALALLKRRIAPLISVIGALLAAIGIKAWSDLSDKYTQALAWHDDIQKIDARARDTDRTLSVVRETMTNLRSAREAAGLNAPVQTPAELRRTALEFERAKAQLYERYVPHYTDYDPAVVFEAVDTFAELAAWGRVDGHPALSRGERVELLSALGFVVRSLGTEDATAALNDRKLRDRYYELAQYANGPDRQQLRETLLGVLARPESPRARDNAAVILASLEEKSASVRDALADMTRDTRPARAAVGAIALAKLLRSQAAWERVKAALEQPSARYEFASLLAQEGPGALRKLAESFGEQQHVGALVEKVRVAISEHKPRNCYEQRYDNWLLACLNGQCGGMTQPIGGECTL